MLSNPIVQAGSVLGMSSPAAFGSSAAGNLAAGNFLELMNSALQNVSAAQNTAAVAEASYAAGVPGATLGNALVTSDRAEVAWNATVAVRNEAVSAYASIMNMQF